MNKLTSLIVILWLLVIPVTLVFTSSCVKKKDSFFVAALGLDKPRVVVASQTATVLTVAAYDLDGNLLQILADYQGENNGPRGLALYDELNLIVSLEGDDRLDLVYLGGGYTTFISNSFLTGTMGKLTRHQVSNDLFIIEAPTAIERYQIGGTRLPQTGNSFVQGAVSACAAPASLRALLVNDTGELIAIQSGTTAAFRYGIGATTASGCTAATLSVAANDVIMHSDGNLYYAGTNSQIYRASQTLTGSTSIFNNTATISTPTAMAELPNGDLIIASDATDSIEVISTSGTYRGSFLKDVNTQTVHSILVVPGQ